jgi:hypothetical protein
MAAWRNYRRDLLQCARFVVDKTLKNICEKIASMLFPAVPAFTGPVRQGLR